MVKLVYKKLTVQHVITIATCAKRWYKVMQNLKQQVINQIKEQGVIAIIRGVKSQDFAPLLSALNDGGVKVAEVTFGAQSDEQTFDLIKEAVSNAKPDQFIGAGTVTCLQRAKIALDAGAKFIVSPNVDVEVIKFCNENGLCIVSGALTPTEIFLAHNSGADFVKVFPANVFGPQYFKTIKSPLGNIPLLAFAGVTCENIGDYVKAGAVGAGIGSELVNLKAIRSGDFEYVKNKAKQFITCVQNAKN